MKPHWILAVGPLVLMGYLLCAHTVEASVKLGTGNSSLLGHDLTDPEDAIKERPGVDYGQALSEEAQRPLDVGWIGMTMSPVSPPGSAPHQIHPYQSWQGAPACAIFLNKPEFRKWYVGFKDGGNGGPTKQAPYYCAVQLKSPTVLTHFTLTTAPDMPERDPLSWAIQGSVTGKDDDWTDIYKCEAAGRQGSPLQANPRGETTLFTSFTSANMAASVNPADLGSLQARLKDKMIEKADFARAAKPCTWYRIVVYSCFNPNTTAIDDGDHPPGFSLGQLELFGYTADSRPGSARPAPAQTKVPAKAVVTSLPPSRLKPPVSDLPFIISYWCGPPKAETTVARYKEIAEAGFNVAYPAIDTLWSPNDKASEEHNRQYLDVCQKVGLKALVWDGSIPKGDDWKAPAPEETPRIEKALDGIIAKYSSHPALLGYVVIDEPSIPHFPRIGVINQYLLKRDPKHLPYINLLPAYAFNPRATYEEHVSKFIETVKPALVSWDHYRQMFEGGDEGTYWYNLELMRKRCTEAGLPYNQIIVSMKHMGYRECSEVDLRWQVYTSLAFGSRGIQYFTYWYVKELAWAQAPALITIDGKRDVKYDYVKKINNRIAKLGPTLVKLVCTGAYCNDPLPPGGVALTDDSPVTKIEGGRALVGCFQDAAGRRFIFPVNRSFNETITLKLTLHPNIVSVAEISQDTGKPHAPTALTDGVLELKLDPGDGKLFVLNDRKPSR